MSNRKPTIPPVPTQQTISTARPQTFEEWIAELQVISSDGLDAIVATQPMKRSVARGIRAYRRRCADYRLARSSRSLASALQMLHSEILRGSFPGFTGEVAQ